MVNVCAVIYGAWEGKDEQFAPRCMARVKGDKGKKDGGGKKTVFIWKNVQKRAFWGGIYSE